MIDGACIISQISPKDGMNECEGQTTSYEHMLMPLGISQEARGPCVSTQAISPASTPHRSDRKEQASDLGSLLLLRE